MAEFSSEGEVPFKEGMQHGSSLSMQELADRVDTLEQVGSLARQLIERVPKSQRANILAGTQYVVGVASVSSGDEYREDPDHIIWIGDDKFKVTRHRLTHTWDGMEEYSLVRESYVTNMTVWDHEHTPPVVQRVSLNQAQEVLDAAHEIHKTDALLAREWLDKTRQFLLQALTSSGQDSASA